MNSDRSTAHERPSPRTSMALHRRMKSASDPGQRRPLRRCVDGLSWVLLGVGLLRMLQARADYNVWPLLGLVLPSACWAVSRGFREQIRRGLGQHWASFESFSRKGGTIPWVAAIHLVVLPAFLFDISNGRIAGAIDTRPVIPTAISLVRDGNIDVSEFDRSDRPELLHRHSGTMLLCYQRIGESIYSSFPPGMVAFAAPVTALARISGADLDQRLVHLRLEKTVAAMVAAFTLGLFFLVACRVGSPRAALLTTGLLATSSAIYTTVGLALWQHGGVTIWMLLALLVELHRFEGPSRGGSLLQSMAFAGMLSCRPTAGLIIATFGLWILLRAPRRGMGTAVAAGLMMTPLFLLYYSSYHNILGPASIDGNTSRGFWNFGRTESMVGVLACPGRGLFVYQPWALLAVGSLLPIGVRWRADLDQARGLPRGWRAFCLSTILAHCFLISAWHDWLGGDCWGSRMLTDIIPLIGLLCVPVIGALWADRRGRIVLVAIALIGSMAHLPCVYLGSSAWNLRANHVVDVWSWSRAPFLYWP